MNAAVRAVCVVQQLPLLHAEQERLSQALDDVFARGANGRFTIPKPTRLGRLLLLRFTILR